MMPHKPKKSCNIPVYQVLPRVCVWLGARLLVVAFGLVSLVGCEPPGGRLAEEQQGPTQVGMVFAIEPVGERLVAVGDHGRVVYSEDQGESWTFAQTPADELLTGVSFVDDRQGWAVGHGPVILHSDDAGRSWTEQSLDADISDPLFDVVFADGQTGVAVGAFGQIRRTTDGGETWTTISLHEQGDGELAEHISAGGVPVADSHFYAITCLPKPACRRLLVAGESGTILRSDDMGKTWQPAETGEDITFFGIITQQDKALAFGMFGRASVSDDGGKTWSPVETGTERTLLAGTWLPDGTAALVGYDGASRLYSTDGVRMEAFGYGSRDMLTAIVALGARSALFAGDMGFVRREISPASE